VFSPVLLVVLDCFIRAIAEADDNPLLGDPAVAPTISNVAAMTVSLTPSA
jgi:hypothetical protein